jgi:hypothetical protein
MPGQHHQAAEQTAREQVDHREDHSEMILTRQAAQARSSNRALQDLHLLMRGCDPQIRRASQGGTARACPSREPLDPLIGVLAPGQERSRGPRLLRRFPSPRRGLAFRGPCRPGWPSIDGGNEEFPLFREISRSSRSTLARSSAIAAACSAITHPVPRTTGTPREAAPERSHNHDQDIPDVIKPAR